MTRDVVTEISEWQRDYEKEGVDPVVRVAAAGMRARSLLESCAAEIVRLRDAASTTARRNPEAGIEDAWGIIANAGGGNWETQTPAWQEAASRWRDRYYLKRWDRG